MDRHITLLNAALRVSFTHLAHLCRKLSLWKVLNVVNMLKSEILCGDGPSEILLFSLPISPFLFLSAQKFKKFITMNEKLYLPNVSIYIVESRSEKTNLRPE